MATFSEYLQSIKTGVEGLGASSELYLTCGNESCDLDSIVSALVYAHYSAVMKLPSNSVSIPLLQCYREELALRPEVQLVFEMLGIKSSDLCCLDDISPSVLSNVGKLTLVLVDHNAPTGILRAYSPNVTKVIDHHQAEENTVAGKDGVSTTLEMAGSCSSLVAAELLKDPAYTLDAALATLLLSAILLDTGNLKAASRVTAADKSAVEELVKILPSSFNLENHFLNLFNARFDVSKLSVQQALQRDYKECTVNHYTIGFSTVTALLSNFLSTENVNSDFAEFYSNHKLDALVVVGVSMTVEQSEVRRQIAVFEPEGVGAEAEFAESIASMLESEENLKCERMSPSPTDFRGFLLQQGNPDMSRKHVLPIVTSFIKSVESEYPRSGLSPSHVVLTETENASSATPASEQYLLEPNVTILSGPEEPPKVAVPTPSKAEATPIPEYTSAEEYRDRRLHRSVSIGEEDVSVRMDLVEPYRKIVQHAGYIGETRQALIVISACYLPPRSLPNYSEVVRHTFYYILSVLDKLIVDSYSIVYLHSGAPRNSMPSIAVLHKFYKNIDRRLRKQLTQLYIVHPTFWVKAILRLSRPFISTKFWRKVHFVPILQDLVAKVQLADDYIPAPVAKMDRLIVSNQPASQKYAAEQKSPDNESKDKEDDIPTETENGGTKNEE